MVRIVNQEQAKNEPTAAPALSEKSKALLQVIGIIISEKPEAIIELLADYSVTFGKEPSDKELVDTVLSAIGECDPDFNSDLASIILDCTLENTYDSFDFKSLFSKNKDTDSGAETGQSSGGAGGGLWAGIANAVGSVGGAIGQGLKGRQAREQATATTLQGMYAYKSQLAANEQSKGKNNLYVLLAILTVAGLAVTALIYFSRRQQPEIIEPQPLPINA